LRNGEAPRVGLLFFATAVHEYRYGSLVKRKTLKAHLLKAEGQVVKGQALVNDQRKLVTSLFSSGESIAHEVEILKQLIEEQCVLTKLRDQLLKELLDLHD
jgi:hypothetical protein